MEVVEALNLRFHFCTVISEDLNWILTFKVWESELECTEPSVNKQAYSDGVTLPVVADVCEGLCNTCQSLWLWLK